MSTHPKRHPWLMFIMAGMLALTAGCDNLGWLSFNIAIPLGLSGDAGLLNPSGDGSGGAPSQDGDIDPPLPIQVGDQPGGGGGTESLNP